ncbi:MAG: SCO family protein [Bacteroidota bacterium]
MTNSIFTFRTVVLLVIIVFSFVACSQNESNERAALPKLGRKQVVEKEVDGKKTYDTIYHSIPAFAFVNQDSALVTEKTFEGKIYVADFFFTSCPSICPIMKTQMLRVYDSIQDESDVMLLSHTIDPEYDTVALLKDYAARLGVTSDKWHFVTGEKDKIYEIGQRSYMVTAVEDPSEPGGYVHSGAFLLIDKDRHVRGVYDGTKAEDVDELLRDLDVLLAEHNAPNETN